jgi:YbbR domain-containing protein
VRRALRFVVHNWPLKVGAVALATLLYGGFVLSQSADNLTSPVRIEIVNAPSDVVVLSNPGSVTRIRYVTPTDLGLRVDSTSFRATVDLEHVDPTGGRVPLDVTVVAVDPKVQVLDFEPRRIVLQLDRKGSKTVPVRAVLDPIPSGLEAGTPLVDASEATVTGPQSVVAGISEVQAPVTIDASGIDVDQLVTLVAIGGDGAPLPALTPVDVSPPNVRVQVPVFTDRRSKTIPVSPNVTGKPAAGFEVASIDVSPPVVSVEGDANDLAGLDSAQTVEISMANASSTVVQSVALALPDGVQTLGLGQVQVTIRLRPVTATRTFDAGLILVGARPDLGYELSTDRVVVTLGGPVAELDRLSGSTFVLTVDVTGLTVGTHTVPVSANLTTGVSLVGASPNPIQVIVSTPASSPAPTAGGSPAP